MKIYGALLLLFQGTTAFFVQSPMAKPAVALRATADPAAATSPSAMSTLRVPAKGGGVASGPTSWDIEPDETVYGDTLRTWAFPAPSSTSTQVVLKTDGRPLNADVEIWCGPDWKPFYMTAYVEDGLYRPFRTMIGSKGMNHAIAVRNTAAAEFPLYCSTLEAQPNEDLIAIHQRLSAEKKPQLVQGGATWTVQFAPNVDMVEVLLNTDGMKLNARVELLQGPNNIKQSFEFHTNGGKDRPFYALIDTPGSGNVVRIINVASVEFPLYAWVGEA